MLEEVLKHVKNLNAKDALGNTALHYAVMTNALQKIEMLKKAGADPRIPNKAGETAFNLAQKLNQKGNSRAYNLLK
jgi:ankyrin repeat protein